jgi:hypothetical protein
MCPKEHKRELDRAQRAALSPEQKALINKRRHDLRVAKNTTRKLQMTPQEKKLKRKETNKKYNTMVKEHRANNLILTQSPWRALTLTLSLFSLLHLNRLKRLHPISRYPNWGARMLV